MWDRPKKGQSVSGLPGLFLEAREGSPSRSKCSTLCDLDSAKWSLKVSQKAPSGRLKLRETLSGAPSNFPNQG